MLQVAFTICMRRVAEEVGMPSWSDTGTHPAYRVCMTDIVLEAWELARGEVGIKHNLKF